MAYPAGMQLVSVTVGSALSWHGEDRQLSVQIRPILGGNAKRLVWGATGQVIVPETATYKAEPGNIVSFTLPHPAYPGLIDGAGNEVLNWSYHATITAGPETWTQAFQPVEGQFIIDLDLVPDGQVTAPTSAPLPLVTSVNGQTGAVVVEGGGEGVSDADMAARINDTETLTHAAVTGLVGDPEPGPVGPSAYDVAVTNGFTGTEAEWLASLQGEPGPDGDPGNPGPPGTGVLLLAYGEAPPDPVPTGMIVLRVSTPVDPGDPPVVTQHPTSQSVTEGDTVTLVAAASGADSTQWQVNTGSGWGDISGATSGVREFTAALSDSGYQFRCGFTNAGGTVYTDPATLTVTADEPTEPGLVTRTLDTIGTPGNWTTSAASLVAALASVDGVYATSGIIQTQLFGTIPAPGVTDPVTSVTVRATARLAAAGGRNLVAAVRPGGSTTNFYHDAVSVMDSTEWTEYAWTWEVDPATTAAWTASAANGISRVYVRASDDAGTTEVELDHVVVEIAYGGTP